MVGKFPKFLRKVFRLEKNNADPIDVDVLGVYSKTADVWEEMLQLMLKAKRSIDIEQYIFIPDSVGNRFLEVIAHKAKNGVKIRIICDMFGSRSLYYSDIPGALRSLGVEVRFFNKLKFWAIFNFFGNFFRDHRKILIVDNTYACIGGVGIRDDMQAWRDTAVVIGGEFVKNMTYSFNLVWERISKGTYARFVRQPIFNKKYELLLNSPYFNQRYIYYSLIERIRHSRKSLVITTPYFIPDNRFMRVVKLAIRRGVEVRVIIPEISNHGITDHARRRYISEILKFGGKVYLYRAGFIHAKYVIVDNEWVTLGSSNIDNLSFRWNHEINLASTDDHLVKPIIMQSHEDMKNSHEVHVDAWNRRPLSWKIKEVIAEPLHIIL